MLNAVTLAQIMGCTEALARRWLAPILQAMEEFAISTTLRQAAFLAQIGHESAGLSRLVENLNYSAVGLRATWPSRFSDAEAQGYARQPSRIANRVYGGRLGNGPEESGDGWRYRGRGLIQLTGRRNYELCGDGLRLDLVRNPDQLLAPVVAARSAGWFWATNGINRYADIDDLDGVSDMINRGRKTAPIGDSNGWADRLARYKRAKRVLGVGP